jgi:hypothetical protein
MLSVQAPSTAGSTGKNPARPGILLGIGLLLCALCCSLPLLAGLGIGGAALLALGGHAERIGIVFIALAALGFGSGLIRRRRAPRTLD